MTEPHKPPRSSWLNRNAQPFGLTPENPGLWKSPEWKTLTPRHQILILGLLALAMRLGFALQNGMLLMPDSYGRYLPIAESLFGLWNGSPFDTPGYPTFLALVFRVFGWGSSLLVVQSLLDTLSVIIIWSLARWFGLRRGAFLLGLYFALHPAAILFSNTVLSEVLFGFLILAAVWFLITSKGSLLPSRAAAAGLLLGLATLTRANGGLCFLVVLVILALTQTGNRRGLSLAVFSLAGLIPIFFWVSFNAGHLGRPVVAQGGGWQMAQNLAYFDLLDPQLLNPEDQAAYSDLLSLWVIHRRLMDEASAAGESARVDPYWRRIVVSSLRANKIGYLTSLPRAFLMPRAFIKDVTKYPTVAEYWDTEAAGVPERYAALVRPLNEKAIYNRLYRVLRTMIFKSKYSILLLCSVPAFFLAWRRRNGPLLLLAALPLSQAAALTLLLNPIERYYYPFESMMLFSLLAAIAGYRERSRKS